MAQDTPEISCWASEFIINVVFSHGSDVFDTWKYGPTYVFSVGNLGDMTHKNFHLQGRLRQNSTCLDVQVLGGSKFVIIIELGQRLAQNRCTSVLKGMPCALHVAMAMHEFWCMGVMHFHFS